MLYDKVQLPELNYMKNRHNTQSVDYNYEKTILENSLSPYLYKNNIMSKFLDKIQPLLSISFDKMNLMKNFKNYMVDKYHYKQRG